MIKNPTPTRRALLVWQRPLEENGRRDRCAVAELTQHSNGFHFEYFPEQQLRAAREAGFSGYPGLPIGDPNLNPIARDVLMRRLPPRGRADFSEFLQRFGLPFDAQYSDLTLLTYTGARLTSDSFSICETFDGFSAPFTYVFDVAGIRHYASVYNDLRQGEPVIFERERENQYDANAIRLADSRGLTISYVNRLQASVIGNWVDQNMISAEIYRVNGRPQYPRVFIKANICVADGTLAA